MKSGGKEKKIIRKNKKERQKGDCKNEVKKMNG